MKRILSLSVIALVLLCTSCRKTIIVTPTPQPENKIAGTWYINDASFNNGNGWYSFDAGAPGIFTFYNNGTTKYSDENGNQNGNWYSGYITSGYYDIYGDYYNDYHNDFQIKVSDNRGNYINLYFDYITFSGNNRFSATYYDGKNIQEYNFYRY